MTMYERMEGLRKKKGVSHATLEKDLGFSNGSYSKWKNSTPNPERLQKLADYFGVSLEYLMNGEKKSVDYVVKTDNGNELLVETYYLNEETRDMAQKIYEHKELRMLFDAARDASPQDLETVHSMLLALKRKEQGYSDEGC